MGTDIHPIVQRREGDKWVNVDFLSAWPDYPRWSNPLRQRDYNAFAILGNVRNGRGFAGVYTNDGFDPISDHRGYPEDFTVDNEHHVLCDRHRESHGDCYDYDDETAVWNCDDCYWMGDHSHTWITAQELIDYDWEAPVRERMVVDYETYKRWAIDGQKQGYPPGFCESVMGPDIVTVSEEAVPLAPGMIAEGKRVFVVAFASYARKEAAPGLYKMVVPWLQTLGDPKDVRIVMGFDS